jgi:hypothetical protein
MRQVYIIFSEVGWAWFALVTAFLIYKTRVASRASRRRGFDVVTARGTDHAK